MDSLPNEILANIYKFLPASDAQRCKRLGRTHRDLISHFRPDLKNVSLTFRLKDKYSTEMVVATPFGYARFDVTSGLDLISDDSYSWSLLYSIKTTGDDWYSEKGAPRSAEKNADLYNFIYWITKESKEIQTLRFQEDIYMTPSFLTTIRDVIMLMDVKIGTLKIGYERLHKFFLLGRINPNVLKRKVQNIVKTSVLDERMEVLNRIWKKYENKRAREREESSAQRN